MTARADEPAANTAPANHTGTAKGKVRCRSGDRISRSAHGRFSGSGPADAFVESSSSVHRITLCCRNRLCSRSHDRGCTPLVVFFGRGAIGGGALRPPIERRGSARFRRTHRVPVAAAPGSAPAMSQGLVGSLRPRVPGGRCGVGRGSGRLRGRSAGGRAEERNGGRRRDAVHDQLLEDAQRVPRWQRQLGHVQRSLRRRDAR